MSTNGPDDQRQKLISYALRHPRGRYESVPRTSQLSGIPRSTIYEWRRSGVFMPDDDHESPTAWSLSRSSTCGFLPGCDRAAWNATRRPIK